MNRFAFIIHPINARDVARKYPVARFAPDRAIEWYLRRRDPIVTAHITGIRSTAGPEAEGWFIGCPLTPHQFLTLPLEHVYQKMEQCGRLAEGLGAQILGLGAFTSVVGDGGITLRKRLNIAVTTGNSYTVATAVEGAIIAAARMGIPLETAHAAVVGASGSIGATCAEILARSVAGISLIGRQADKLTALAARLGATSRAEMRIATDVEEGLRDADIVIAVSSAVDAIVLPAHIKSGAVVCDVARPRDVSTAVARERNDVVVIEGGVVHVPGEMRCTVYGSSAPFSFGFPPETAYACMSETMALALSGRYEDFTLGKEVSPAQVDEIDALCSGHGFKLEGFRSFERAVSDAEIEQIRVRAGRGPALAPPTGLPREIGCAVTQP